MEVHEAELSEESEEKERKVAAQRRVAQSRVVLRVKEDMWWRMGTWWPWKAELARACARFCPWFAKIICCPVTGTCLAELSKPCANLALPCSTTAFSWGPATKRKGKSMRTALKWRLGLFFLLYLFGKHPRQYCWTQRKVLLEPSRWLILFWVLKPSVHRKPIVVNT